MLTQTTVDEMERLIAQEHPYWNEQAVKKLAEEYVATFDSRLDEPLRLYFNGLPAECFRYQDFSIYQIRHLKSGRSFLTAVMMMNEYIKDADNGKRLILRR